jgi:Holliday junction resolvasome RuvABC endonuclease subunit
VAGAKIMTKVLAFDPGAERMGWALIEGTLGDRKLKPRWWDSGIIELHRGSADFQEYKLKLIRHVHNRVNDLIAWLEPDEVSSEIVPAVGGGNFIAATQSHLAHTAATVTQAVAISHDLQIFQIGATTVKKNIGGNGKATKVKVRNGVYHFFPFLKESRGEFWKKVFDESDAIAIGLAHLGYSIPK